MRGLLFAALCALAAPAAAQIDNPSVTPSALDAAMAAVQATIPQAGSGSPTAVVDANSGTAGSPGLYAPFLHTHPSKARKGRVLVPITGFTDVTFSTAFPGGTIPLCSVVAETTAGDTNVVNAQIDGVTTATGLRIRVTRTAITVASLLGLNILSVPTQIATYAHYICIEP